MSVSTGQFKVKLPKSRYDLKSIFQTEMSDPKREEKSKTDKSSETKSKESPENRSSRKALTKPGSPKKLDIMESVKK